MIHLAAYEVLDEGAETIVNTADNECYHNGNNQYHDSQVKDFPPWEPGYFLDFSDDLANQFSPGARRLAGRAISH